MPDYRVIVHNNDTRAAEVVWEHEQATSPLGALDQIVQRRDSLVLVPADRKTIVLDTKLLYDMTCVIERVAETPLALTATGITTSLSNDIIRRAKDALAKLQEITGG